MNSVSVKGHPYKLGFNCCVSAQEATLTVTQSFPAAPRSISRAHYFTMASMHVYLKLLNE